MQPLRDVDCYISGLNHYYDEIITDSGVCDAVEFELLSEFKIRLDEFGMYQTKPSFDRLCNAYDNFYVDGFLHKKFIQHDLQEQFDCISELMMRLKKIYNPTS